MAKEYTGKAKAQLQPEMAETDEKFKNIRSKIDSIFTSTKKVRDQMTRNLELFEGNMWNEDDEAFQGKERSTAQYNTIFATVQSTAPMVTDNRPITRVAPRFPWMEKLGVQLNNMTKYFWHACDMQMVTYRWVMDAMIFGHGVVKVGYNPKKVFGGQVEVSLIDPRDFFIAPGYETIWDAPFCGVRTDKPISWIRDNFPEVEEVRGAQSRTDSDKAKKNFKFGDIDDMTAETEFVTVYELWTRDETTYEELTEEDENGEKTKKRVKKYPYGKLCFFTEQQWLGEEAIEDEHGIPPYVEMWDYIRPHDFTGMSEVTQIEGLHKELNLLLKYLTEYVRRYHNPNLMIDTSTMIDEELIKSRYWEGGQAFTYDGMAAMGREPVTPMQEPQLNPEVFTLFSIIPQIIEEISGVTDVTKGQVGKQERQSASEIAILLESSHTRTRQRVRNMEWSLKRVYYLLLRLVMQHYEAPRTISFEENGNQIYDTFANDKTSAQEVMQPNPLPERLRNLPEGLPITNKEDMQILQQHEQEVKDYDRFLEYFREVGDLDPIFYDFDIEIQTDSMLPMDKQARANLYLRLLQLKAIDPQAVLEFLQIPNASEIIARMMKMAQAAKGGQPSPQQIQQLMAQKGAQRG